MPINRIVVLGDPHGCLDEVRRALDAIRFDPAADEVWSSGDNLDRGPDPLGVCQFLVDLGARTLLGNHEAKVLRFHDWQARAAATREAIPMSLEPEAKRSYEAIREDADVLRWLQAALLGRFIPESWVFLVHAGVRPGRSTDRLDGVVPPWGNPGALREFKDLISEATTLRYVRCRGDGSFQQIGLLEASEGDLWWADNWNLRAPHVVFGHQPFREVRRFPNATGIDQGCCFGGALTAVAIPLGERNRRGWTFRSTPAARVYYTPQDGRESFPE